jgi:hypothetical protein
MIKTNFPRPLSELVAAPLPQQTETYTVISHKFVDDEVKRKLLEHNFTIEKTEYRSNYDSTVASGIYFIQYGNDPELSMMVSWVNSYDKSTSFGFTVGAYNKLNMGAIVPADASLWSRVHTGDAVNVVKDYIHEQIVSADKFYNQLILDKNKMMGINISKRTFSELIGRLFFEHGLLTNFSLTTIKKEYKKPSFVYSNPGSLWFNYCHIIYALRQHAHPSEWIETMKMIHFAICQDFNLFDYDEEVKTPSNQIDLEDMIAEVKKEQEEGLVVLGSGSDFDIDKETL